MSDYFRIIKDESQVPNYELPALLQMESGAPVDDAAMWRAERRPEILRLFEENVYGRTPRESPQISWEVVESGDFGDSATRRQIAIHFGAEKSGPCLNLLLYLPKSSAPCPIFLGLNFGGNHAVHPDAAILLAHGWMANNAEQGVTQNRASEAGRGKIASYWPLETILERGYGVATAYYGDLDPDFDDGFENGIHSLFSAENGERAPDEWGAIGAWAWGLSRALDYLESDPAVDARRVAVLGHSRLGKAALWAGAQDERFALVISIESGCGGAALFRRCFGETTEIINSKFPHWFCANFHRFGGRENALPVDQHQLFALVAPRPLYVASAEKDLWADPRGEWLAVAGADPLYRFLGVEGHGADAMPPVEEPVLTRLGYHIRSGDHDVTAYDWACFLDFADRHLT